MGRIYLGRKRPTPQLRALPKSSGCLAGPTDSWVPCCYLQGARAGCISSDASVGGIDAIGGLHCDSGQLFDNRGSLPTFASETHHHPSTERLPLLMLADDDRARRPVELSNTVHSKRKKCVRNKKKV